MSRLTKDIAAFDRMRPELEARHLHQWVLFHAGRLEGAFSDFDAAATVALERFEDEPCLIRQVGAGEVQLPGGMIFRPSHALDTRGL